MTRIGVISDIHYKPSTHEVIVSELEALVETFEFVNPTRVVVLGDMIHEGESLAADEEHAAVVEDVLTDLSCPVRYLPGNHDVGNGLSADYWDSVYGHSPWAAESDASVAFLNSSAPRLENGRGELTDEQIDDLVVTAGSWEDGLVFVHHPLHYTDTSDNRWFGEAPEEALCGNKRTFWERLGDDPPIAATINGHLHQSGHNRYRGVDHFTVESFNKELAPEEPYGAYAVVERDSDLQVQLVYGDGRSETHCIPL